MFRSALTRMAVLGSLISASLSHGAAIPFSEARPIKPRVKPGAQPQPSMAKRISRGSTWFSKRHGARECERRMRQIAAGTLRIQNGLLVQGLRYIGHNRAINANGENISVQ